MPNASEVVSARLRARRSELGLSAPELAERLGVTRQTIYRWESGEDIPHPDRQVEVADALDAPWAELFSPVEGVA